MLIRSPKNTYIVAEGYERSGDVEEFAAIDAKGERFYIARMAAQAEEGGVYMRLEQIRAAGHFTDLREHFFEDGFLNIVFRKSEEPLLKDRLKSDTYSISERLIILKEILEKLQLQELPPFFACGVLNPEGIRLSDSLKPYFEYDCRMITKMDSVTYSDTAAAFSRLCMYMFEKEFALGRFRELTDLCSMLSGMSCSGYMQIYQSFYPIYFEFSKYDDAHFRPDNFQVKLHKFLVRLFSYRRVFICTAVFIAAAIYLGFAVRNNILSDEREPYFDAIGALVLTQDEAGEGGTDE